MGEAKFHGEHLRFWQAQNDLKGTFQKTLQRIEDFGCEVWTIASDNVTPSFSYTVGVSDVSGGPELITIALSPSVVHHALNEAAKLIRAGVDLTIGRHPGLVGDVDVEFRPVDPKCLHHIMLRTDWYYRGEDVPVLQMIYPDLQNRFPEDQSFDTTFAQPFLSGGASEHETTTNDLWLAYDEASSLSRWKFPDPPHVGVYLSRTVNDEDEAVTYVSHDADGDWQFLGDKMDSGGGPVLSCFHHPIDHDRTLEELHDLPLNWYAVRESIGTPWERFEHPEDKHAEINDESPAEPPMVN